MIFDILTKTHEIIRITTYVCMYSSNLFFLFTQNTRHALQTSVLGHVTHELEWTVSWVWLGCTTKLCMCTVSQLLFSWLTGNEWVNWTNVRKGILADLWLVLTTHHSLCVSGGSSPIYVMWMRKTYSITESFKTQYCCYICFSFVIYILVC